MRGEANQAGTLLALLGGLVLAGGSVAAVLGAAVVAGMVALGGYPDGELVRGLRFRDMGLATAGVGLALLGAGLLVRRAPSSWGGGAGRPLHGMVLAAGLLHGALLALMLVLPGAVTPDPVTAPEPPEVDFETFDGTAEGFGPLAGVAGPPSPAVMSTDVGHGVVRGSLNWTQGPGSPPALVLVLEVREGDAWREVAREEGGPGMLVESGAVDVDGQVRASVLVGGPAGAGSQDYSLTLTVLAVEPPSRTAVWA